MAGRAFKLTAPVSSPRPRLTLKEPVPPEQDLQAGVCKMLTMLLKPPAIWWAMPIGHVQLSAAQTAKLSRIGLRRGLPDLMLLHGGRVFGIELKRAGGRLSQTRTVRTRSGGLRELAGQADVFPRLEAAGMRIAVCSSEPEVLEQCRAWGLPVRGAVVAA